jgi:hypothetical protein
MASLALDLKPYVTRWLPYHLLNKENTNHIHSQVKVKLDSCGSVSIAHSDYLIQVKPAMMYGLQSIRLLGIGEKTNYLKEVGVFPVKKDDEGVCFMLCYVFNTPLGDTNKIILLGLYTRMKANINILKHMKDSLEGKCTPLSFWPHGMSCDEALKGLSCEDDVGRIFKIKLISTLVTYISALRSTRKSQVLTS